MPCNAPRSFSISPYTLPVQKLLFYDYKAWSSFQLRLCFLTLGGVYCVIFEYTKYIQWSESHSVMSSSSWSRGLYCSWNSPGQNAGLVCLFLLQGIFATQGSNPGLPHCRLILYQLSHKGSPRILEWITYPFSSRSSWPGNWTGVSCIAGGFFTNWAIRDMQLSNICSLIIKNTHVSTLSIMN